MVAVIDSKRRGVTLIEVLVIIFLSIVVLGVLAAALNATRESARRSSCIGNQKQTALAIKSYEEKHRSYPPSAFRVDADGITDTYLGTDRDSVASSIVPASAGNFGTAAPYGMFVKLLPYMELARIYDQFDFTLDAFNAGSNQNTDFADLQIPQLICPSFSGSTTTNSVPYDEVNAAITNYKTYGATDAATLDNPNIVLGNIAISAGSFMHGGGMLHPYGAARAPKATSLTILCNETREETLAAWYDGTTTALYGLVDIGGVPQVGLNNKLSEDPTSVIYQTYGGEHEMTWGPSSEHPGITNHSFADGSVRSIPDDASPVTFGAMITRASNDNGVVGEWLASNGDGGGDGGGHGIPRPTSPPAVALRPGATGEGLFGRPDAGIGPSQGGDKYATIYENAFRRVAEHPQSTFSIDVDSASYANTRRYLLQNRMLPPSGAVRIEELVNYFAYDYAAPEDDVPFATHVEVAACPWQPQRRLMRVALKAREIDNAARPSSNLVFLIDVSGSMGSSDKLPLLLQGMGKLVNRLGENDRVAIVVYAGAAGLALPSTPGSDKVRILGVLNSLHAGGSTAGGEGITLAYDTAIANFIEGGTNRVLLCTDGDFNVGDTSTASLTQLVEEKAKAGIFLSVLGFGRGNFNDAMMEEISNRGNGNYAYIDNDREAVKVLVEQMGGTLVAVAKDVKIQIEFNPAEVAAYRLIGYENRMLKKEDFNDDKKDAGEIGAGHTVTAFYELKIAGLEDAKDPEQVPAIDDLEFQQRRELSPAAAGGKIATLKLRYKEPNGDESKLLKVAVRDGGQSFDDASGEFRFAAGVAAFGMLLRHSKFKGESSLDAVEEIVRTSRGDDVHGYREELLELVFAAKQIQRAR